MTLQVYVIFALQIPCPVGTASSRTRGTGTFTSRLPCVPPFWGRAVCAGGPGRRRSPAMAAPGGLGRCVAAFWLALAFDALGLAVLLAGVFADVFFADLLIYAGGIGIFLSLIWWVFWYAGNLEVPLEELRDDVGLAPPKGRGDSVLRGLVHGLSRRLSSAFGSAPRTRAAAAATADLELRGPRGRPAEPGR
uniref:Transmembrane protein 238 n=1 Tax=Cairina moschata TaxID=8855 RepID=A0A8C3CMF4_CAIMO